MSLAVLNYPQIDPFIFRIGSFGVTWYACAYLISFLAAYLVIQHRYQNQSLELEKKQHVGLLITYLFYGLILGARIFYVVFYNPQHYLNHPLDIPAVWKGGMSFHGGLVGGVVGLVLFCRRHKAKLFQVLDSLTLVVPLGLGLGRIANFINGELYGRVSDVPWAMVFPDGGDQPRHPSQLYESFLEGPILFLILWLTLKQKPKDGIITAVGIITYGIIRFGVEFVREPDAQLGTILGPFSMGQLLSTAMILAGITLFLSRKKNKAH